MASSFWSPTSPHPQVGVWGSCPYHPSFVTPLKKMIVTKSPSSSTPCAIPLAECNIQLMLTIPCLNFRNAKNPQLQCTLMVLSTFVNQSSKMIHFLFYNTHACTNDYCNLHWIKYSYQKGLKQNIYHSHFYHHKLKLKNSIKHAQLLPGQHCQGLLTN